MTGNYPKGRAAKAAGGLFLRDLNRSAVWEGGRAGTRRGCSEGFLVLGDKLAEFKYDFEGAEIVPCAHPAETGFVVGDLRACGVATRVIDLAEWGFSALS